MSISVLDPQTVTPFEVDEDQLPCRRENPELFFAESPVDVETAKALCVDCPIRTECLAGALERREPWIWHAATTPLPPRPGARRWPASSTPRSQPAPPRPRSAPKAA